MKRFSQIMRRMLSVICLLTVTIFVAHAENYLFRNGQSDYEIVVSKQASKTERNAATEFQMYVQRIGRVTLPIVSAPTASRKHIFIGWQQQLPGVLQQQPETDDEGFVYYTVGNDLVIYGGSERGTMYGVFTFLERELGVHWLTSSVSQVLQQKKYELCALSHAEQPVILNRLDFCYDALRHTDWTAHNLLNCQHRLTDGQYGRLEAYWGIHTFHTLIPPERYFSTHPEYFSIYQGKRSDKAQLCLSNSAMQKELVRNLKEVIRTTPGYWCYDVSQNDNKFPCECRKCQKLVKKYGGQSGAMLWFVNKVAAEVKKEFPQVLIGTFAYQYTRQAPKSNIRPADNVVIRLCDIECCMAHSLEECEQNRSFVNDMNEWRRIARRIYIWDYTTGFQHYLLPFPNFKTLAANYRYFKESNVIGIMEEGAHDAPWSEFSELKQWMIAKLLWNPYQDTDSLAQVFINSYYGKAAPSVMQYYQLCQSLVHPDSHFTIGINWKSTLYNDSFVADGLTLLRKAEAAAGNDKETAKRVNRLTAQLYYLKFRKAPAHSVADGTVKSLKNIMKTDSTIVREFGYTFDQLLKDTGYH